MTTDDESPGTSRPLLLLNSRSRSLISLLSLVRPAFRGIIVDIPGLGVSSPPPDGASMSDVASCMVELLDELRIESTDVFGFFTGHKVAAALAADHPHRIARLVVAGKTHSLIPDLAARNRAMQGYLARRLPDAAIMQLEGKFVDDTTQQAGFEAIFRANYAFDFARALRAVHARTLILEVVTEAEDAAYGRQGAALAGMMKNATAVAENQSDPTGLEMYIGAQRMASRIVDFLSLGDTSHV